MAFCFLLFSVTTLLQLGVSEKLIHAFGCASSSLRWFPYERYDRFRKSCDRWTPFLRRSKRWYGNQPLWCMQLMLPCSFFMIFWLLACIIARWSTLKTRPYYDRGLWKSSFIFTVRPSIHTNPSRKRRFLVTLFKLEEFENADF